MIVQRACGAAVFILSVALAATVQGGPGNREEVSLNGAWEFYPEGKETKHEIRVPSFWDAPQDYGYPEEWLHMRHGVYRRKVRIPESMRGKQIFLKIERVSVIAKVRVNDQAVGGEDSGGYLMMQLPYLIDITRQVKLDGENLIEVAAWGGKSIIHGSDSQDNLKKENDFPADAMSEGNFLYPFCVDHWDGRRGLNGDVALVAYPKLHVSDVFVITDLHKNLDPTDDEITLRLTLTNRDSKTRTAQLRNVATLRGGGGSKSFEPLNVILPADSTIEIAIPNVRWPDAAYWWPHDPRLYVLETTLVEDGEPVDTCRTGFGFRQFYVDGDHYKLNGIRANLRGDAYEFSWHEGYRHGPSTAPVLSTKELVPQMQERLVREFKKLNNNLLRPHKASAIDEVYDLCDENGLFVIDEAPFWETFCRTDERSKPNYEAWVRRWVRERRNHPSIVAWIAANECWNGPTALYSIEAVRSMDPSRPVFHDDPYGPGRRDRADLPPAGDADVRHYTGGYPMKALNTEKLYEVYKPNPSKPTGEGECLFSEGWPLMNADGTLTGKCSERGQFGHPDMISQAQWLRAVCRLVRAMRYAGLSDCRLYANWMYALDPIEADLSPKWDDPAASGIQPTVLRRPIVNVFERRRPEVRYNPAYAYYRNTFAAVAAFDKEADRQARIGAAPVIFQPGQTVERTLVIYNDEFKDGEDVQVIWTAESINPQDNSLVPIDAGVVRSKVPLGGRGEQSISFKLPEGLAGGRWLVLSVAASKKGKSEFLEFYRLGAIGEPPAAKVGVVLNRFPWEPRAINIGSVKASDAPQWHVVRLINNGGGASEKWTLTGADEVLSFNLASGNLRGEQEIYFQISAKGLKPGEQEREFKVAGEGGSSETVRVRFRVVE